MRVIVQKYGGSSLASLERIKAVALQVCQARERGFGVVVVASAIGDTTDALVDMVAAITDRPPQRELGLLLSTGEIVSASLLAMALQALGKRATSLTGPQCGIFASGSHERARIAHINSTKVLSLLQRGDIVVVAGYQGQIADDIAVLGRGGSDASAVALAAALNAERCEIYTDVDGVYTCDPRRAPAASPLPRISYEEMLELAGCGAQVMMGRAVEIARKYGVRIRVASSFNRTHGTLITRKESGLENLTITGIAARDNIALVEIMSLKKLRDEAMPILRQFADADINIGLLTTNCCREQVQYALVVNQSHIPAITRILESGQQGQVLTRYQVNREVAQVSVVGFGIAENAGVAFEVFDTLARKQIEVLLTSTSEIKISVLVPLDKIDQAVRCLHTHFGLDDLRDGALPAPINSSGIAAPEGI